MLIQKKRKKKEKEKIDPAQSLCQKCRHSLVCPWAIRVRVGWLCCPIVWNPSGKWAHTQMVRECLSTLLCVLWSVLHSVWQSFLNSRNTWFSAVRVIIKWSPQLVPSIGSDVCHSKAKSVAQPLARQKWTNLQNGDKIYVTLVVTLSIR